MALMAIVREVLHDGQYGSTLLVKDESLLVIQQSVINRSGCHLAETVSPIASKKAFAAFELLTDLNLSKMDKFIIDLDELFTTHN